MSAVKSFQHQNRAENAEDPKEDGVVKSRKSPKKNKFIHMRKLSEIKHEPVGWVWPDVIPAGKISTIAGDPGLGKS